jgi:hypothetical protein
MENTNRDHRNPLIVNTKSYQIGPLFELWYGKLAPICNENALEIMEISLQ